MKKRYLYLLMALITVSACQNPDEFLDVEPTGVVIPTTLEDYDKMLQDYAILRSVGKNTRFIDPDVFHNDRSFASIANTYEFVSAYTWQHDIFEPGRADSDYADFYYYIHVMNEILSKVDGAEPGNFNEANRNYVKGDALAQRAFEYFLLVNEYAHHYDPANLDEPGVPMPLKVDLQAQLGRSTVGEIYTQILKDLNAALNAYGDGYLAINSYANFRPGRASVYALLAEVNLFMGDFDDAVINSNKALELYSFLYDYKTIGFTNPSNLWSGYNNSQQFYFGTLNREVIWNRYNYWGFTNPFHLYAPDLEALYDKANDRRWFLFSNQKSSSGIDVSPYYVYMHASSERNIGLSVPRLMLTNAEAKVRTNDGAGAITVMNRLLQNRLSNFTQLSYVNDATTLQLIKNERRKELAGTSINVFDQKRYHVYGDPVPTYTRTNPLTGVTYTLEPGDDGYVVEISRAVKDINPKLN